jgi:hypothetical protein
MNCLDRPVKHPLQDEVRARSPALNGPLLDTGTGEHRSCLEDGGRHGWMVTLEVDRGFVEPIGETVMNTSVQCRLHLAVETGGNFGLIAQQMQLSSQVF